MNLKSSSLGTLDKEYRNFIKHLSEIRDTFVHNIKNVNLSLNEYYANAEEKKKNTFLNLCKKMIIIDDEKITAVHEFYYLEHARLCIFFMVLDILELIYKRKTHWIASKISEWLNEQSHEYPFDVENFFTTVELLSESGSIKK